MSGPQLTQSRQDSGVTRLQLGAVLATLHFAPETLTVQYIPTDPSVEVILNQTCAPPSRIHSFLRV